MTELETLREEARVAADRAMLLGQCTPELCKELGTLLRRALGFLDDMEEARQEVRDARADAEEAWADAEEAWANQRRADERHEAAETETAAARQAAESLGAQLTKAEKRVQELEAALRQSTSVPRVLTTRGDE
jgi:chromosome segregation ATPase